MGDLQSGEVRGVLAKVLPDPDTTVQVLRLCIAYNVLLTLHKVMLAAEPTAKKRFRKRPPRETPAHELILFFVIIGALKEAADALRHFSPRMDKAVARFAKDHPDLSSITQSWDRIKKAIDKTSSTSIWTTILEPVRRDAAFHWNDKAILRAIESLHLEEPIFRTAHNPRTYWDLRFTFADQVLAHTGLKSNEIPSISGRIVAVREFAIQLLTFLSNMLPYYLLAHGCKFRPFK